MKKFNKFLPYIVTVISILILITCSGDLPKRKFYKFTYGKAKVLKVINEDLNEDHIIPRIYIGYQNVEVKILTGEKKGDIYTIKNSMSRLYNIRCKEGDTVVVSIDPTGKAKYPASVYSYYREPVIYTLIGIFFIALIIFGGLKGLKTIITLVITGICLLFGFIPLIFNGYSPIAAAIITITIVTLSTFLLVSGWNRKSFSAALGTVSGVIIAGIITHFAAEATSLLGLATEDGERLIYIAQDTNLKIRGLLFAAILIASMGAVMDVAMSISSSIFEIYRLNPKTTKKQLFQSGMNVGKDIMGTMANTLILAFLGGSINLVIYIVAYNIPYLQFMNIDVVCIELIQALAGSIGIVLTVPVTSLYVTMLIDYKK